jgi:hypothetical protein
LGQGQPFQAQVKFVSTSPDGLLIQTADQGQLAFTRTIRLLRQQPHIPTPLGFRQPAQKQVDLLVVMNRFGMTAYFTNLTFTLMNRHFYLLCYSLIS